MAVVRDEDAYGATIDIDESLGTKVCRSPAVFVDSSCLTVRVVVVIRSEARVPPGTTGGGIRTHPIAAGSHKSAESGIAFMICDPPSMEIEGTGAIVVRRKRAVAILEGRLPVVTAGAVQGDRSV